MICKQLNRNVLRQLSYNWCCTSANGDCGHGLREGMCGASSKTVFVVWNQWQPNTNERWMLELFQLICIKLVAKTNKFFSEFMGQCNGWWCLECVCGVCGVNGLNVKNLYNIYYLFISTVYICFETWSFFYVENVSYKSKMCFSLKRFHPLVFTHLFSSTCFHPPVSRKSFLHCRRGARIMSWHQLRIALIIYVYNHPW